MSKITMSTCNLCDEETIIKDEIQTLKERKELDPEKSDEIDIRIQTLVVRSNKIDKNAAFF